MGCSEYTIPGYVSKLSTALYQLQKQGDMCDVVLATKHGCLNVHKVVLATTESPFFHTHVSHLKTTNLNEPTVIDFHEETLTNIQSVIKYLYTGQVDLSDCNVVSLKNLFHFLQLEDAIKVCEQFIERYLDSEEDGKIHVPDNKIDITSDTVLLSVTNQGSTFQQINSSSSILSQNRESPSQSRTPVLRSRINSLVRKKRKHMLKNRKNQCKDESSNTPQRAIKTCSHPKMMEINSRYQYTYKNSRPEGQKETSDREVTVTSNDEVCHGTKEEAQTLSLTQTENKYHSGNECLEQGRINEKQKSCGKKLGKRVNKVCAHCKADEKQCKCRLGPKGFHKKCPGCNLRFLDRSQMYAHMKEKHSFHCDLCDYHHFKERCVAQHMFIHHNRMLDDVRYPVLLCDQEGCGYKCIELNQYKRHKTEKHGNPKFSCSVCGKQFRSGPQYRMHCKSHLDEELKFLCTICGRKFHQQGLLNGHMKHVHSRQKLCHLCTWKGTHLRDLQVHLYTKHGQSLPDGFITYNCDQCDYIAFYPKVLKNHMLLHTGEKSFQCQECGKLFATIHNLRGHTKMHGEKKFKCTYKECDYKTVDGHKLKLHINSRHMDIKPFSCHMCPYSCKLRGNLDKHLRGTHKLTVTTSRDLWNKMKENGQGYEAVLERRRMIQNKETISLSTENSELVPGNNPSNIDGYQDFTSPVCNYTVLPVGSVEHMHYGYDPGVDNVSNTNMQIRNAYHWT